MNTPPTDEKTRRTKIEVVATSDELEVGILKAVGGDIVPELIEVSESLADKFGPSAKLTEQTIPKYFDYPNTFPFVARFQKEIIGYIIGVPLEQFRDDLWSQCDSNLGRGNTIYTYAFTLKKQFHGTGYAKVLKRVYFNWMRKRGVEFISGHVVEGKARRFNGRVEVLETFDNWHGTGTTFEYYRRPIQNPSRQSFPEN